MGPSNLERPILLSLDLLMASALMGQPSDTSSVPLKADTVMPANDTLGTSTILEGTVEDPAAAAQRSDLFFSLPTYRISIGASFDFIEKFKASNVYGDLIIDLPEALRSQRATSGFLGGIYQVRSVTVDSFIPEQDYLVSITPLPGNVTGDPGDSSIIQLSTATGIKRRVADNLYFFASLYRPWHLSAGIPGSSGLYHLFFFDVVRTREQITETYTRTASDTVFVSTSTDHPALPHDSKYMRTRNDWQVGYGQMLRHEFDDLALQFYGVLTCAPSTMRISYLLSFNTIGSRSGLIAGAEIRSDPLIGGQQYNVFLAKTFKLADMARLITSY